ncbi:hypothetical protein V1264_024488 [Littorina saxatilis]|uniref:Tox-ART-HYD1 domain-containing protein n=1 Tax=Littorina saxatilis TaxID=31220 RepID=A0AAN9AMM4_9CAEN
MGYTDFYHYTSQSGKNAIIACGYIRENSTGGRHAHFGRGVYGTSLSPSSGKSTIASNNWKGHGRNYILSGSCDWAIKVRIPSDKVESVGPWNRDILVYREQLNLKDFTYETIEVPF